MEESMKGVSEWQSATPIPSHAKRMADPQWEQKQRAREYRVAARREKRNRKADEKKQRKLNATILRRMTRNPEKYTKNTERNRLRAIEIERRQIQNAALKQVQRLAAVHDPSGASFGIGPVKIQEDGIVVSLEALRRREERKKELQSTKLSSMKALDSPAIAVEVPAAGKEGVETWTTSGPNRLSKTQLKKLAAMEPRPPPPRPVIPHGVKIPEGEENWLSLWDLTDAELERRVLREKKRKATVRKALRLKQQAGKAERRAARDEKRRVYRDLKLTWKAIKEEGDRLKTALRSAENEEAKRIAVEVSSHERQVALAGCEAFGYTLDNTPGVENITPRLLGMKGQTVDFQTIEQGDSLNTIKTKATKDPISRTKRADLSTVPRYEETYIMPGSPGMVDEPGEFLKFDVGDSHDFEALNYNHKLRRKIRRAMDNAQIQKEMLVRERVHIGLTEQGFEVPIELSTPAKPIHERGQRLLPSGLLETEKSERVRLRMELAEFNEASRVLRKQAKEIAIEEGLRAYAERTGKIAPCKNSRSAHYGEGWRPIEA